MTRAAARASIARSNAHCPIRCWRLEGVKLRKSRKDSYDRQRGDRTHYRFFLGGVGGLGVIGPVDGGFFPLSEDPAFT